MRSLVILISGRGSNMRAIVEAMQSQRWPARVAAVISNRADADGLSWARQRGIPAVTLEHTAFASREAFDSELSSVIDRHAPDAIALAGFMRILGEGFVRRYEGRLVNIHPSLLPAFPGLNTHRQALEHGVKVHGCTVHFVTSRLDHGPIIAQAAVPVLPRDTEQSLAERVLAEEHRVYPEALRWLLEGRLVVEAGVVRVNHAMAPSQPVCQSNLITIKDGQ
jgi:phosphoribosylglycinamide formyltransferase-1